ncbi:MAG: hypothetical protein IK083_01645 [Abditibacteriota bacterium]|nr:hypothetical protein [Abditibacteriota bacterium]
MKTLYIYTPEPSASPEEAYDRSLILACLQGLVNRQEPCLYVIPREDPCARHSRIRVPSARFWLDVMQSGGRWLSEYERVTLDSLDEVFHLARQLVKGIVVWDPMVPATVNLATTFAGLEDSLVMSPEQAQVYSDKWQLPIKEDFRGRFDGSVTGSAKNDAYRYAIGEYLPRCSVKYLYLYEDAWQSRSAGSVRYTITRDWSVMNRGFVYDLSPWGDEPPADDEGQRLGTDLETYRMMLQALDERRGPGEFTEVCGFFCFNKYSRHGGHRSSHEPVPTEWETVYVISPYNCYQNTVASDCYNQSVHSHFVPRKVRQGRPKLIEPDPTKTYVSVFMADYDSATPLYDFLPEYWSDPERGSAPFTWGINPSLADTYPDIMDYIYETRTDADVIAADASCAGYFNPNRIPAERLPAFAAHNKKYYDRYDMSLSPMVLDWDQPTGPVKDAFRTFSPDGFATIVMDMHMEGGAAPADHNWKQMPVTTLENDLCNFASTEKNAGVLAGLLRGPRDGKPGHLIFRIVWTSPSEVIKILERTRELRPDLDIEVVDGYNFFNICKNIFDEKGE